MKHHLLTIGFIALSVTAYAAPLTPEEAIARIRETGEMLHIAPAKDAKMILAAEICRTAIPEVYLFNREGGGFMIVSADDSMPPLLGYADEGELPDDLSKWPDGFRYWMDQYAEQVEWVRNNHGSGFCNVVRPEREPISPLCHTRWDQGFPYNLLLPDYGIKSFPTGCGATALAQIMKYHNWPERGEGSISYNWKNGQPSVEEDFSEVVFNWARMRDEYPMYGGNYTQSEAMAVAQLMKSVGYSVQMKYAWDGSSTFPEYFADALGTYFGYDKSSMRYLRRDHYSLNEWEEMIYNSLATDGPVSYNGQSTDGGHSFVCDGYSSDGYFHINWGWGGLSDGWYLLDTLDPYAQGTGGSRNNTGFNYDQEVVLGIRPASGENNTWASPSVYASAPYTISAEGSNLVFSSLKEGEDLMIENCSMQSIEAGTWGFGVRLEEVNNPEKKLSYAVPMGTLKAFQPSGGSSIEVPAISLTPMPEDGTYSIIPGYSVGASGWIDFNNMTGYQSSFHLVVNEGVPTVTFLSQPEVVATGVEVTKLVNDHLYRARCRVENVSEGMYRGTIVPVVFSGSGKREVSRGTGIVIELAGGESREMEFVSSLENYTPGAYRFGFCSEVGGTLTSISEKIETPIEVSKTDLDAEVIDAEVSAEQFDNINVSGKLSVSGGYYAGPVIFAIASYPDLIVVSETKTDYMFVCEGEENEFSLTCDFSEGDESRTWLYGFMDYSGRMLSEPGILHIGSGSGIECDVIETAEPEVYYNLQGLRIAAPEVGQICLRRRGEKIEKIMMR